MAEYIPSTILGREVDEYMIRDVFQLILIVIIGLGIALPIIFLIFQSFSPQLLANAIPSTVVLDNYTTELQNRHLHSAIKNSVIYTGIGVPLAHIYGFILAFILTKIEVPYRGKFHALMFLPIFVSPLILALGWNYGFSGAGYFAAFFNGFLGLGININNIWGMAFLSSIFLSPYAYAFISAGLRNIEPELEEAAHISGASRMTTIRRVTIPLLKPFVASSILLTVLLSFQAVSIPAVLGIPSRIYVMSTYLLTLEQASIPPPYGRMAVVGMVMIVFALVMAVVITRFIGNVGQYAVVSGRGGSHTLMATPKAKAFSVVVLLSWLGFFIILPLFQLLSIGLTEGGRAGMLEIDRLSLVHFETVLRSGTARSAIQNSVLLAILTATVSIFITGFIAYFKIRVKNVFSQILVMLAWVPIATPGIVLGVAFLFVYLFLDIGLYGTIWALFFAFLIRFLAFGVRMNDSLITQQSPSLDEQAMICGAGLFTRAYRIMFPSIKTGLVSVWVILFTVFMNELATSWFLYTSDSRVITVTLFEWYFAAQTGSIAVLGMIQIAITLTLIGLAILLFDIEIRAV